jgi:hypothetical protein
MYNPELLEGNVLIPRLQRAHSMLTFEKDALQGTPAIVEKLTVRRPLVNLRLG